MAEMTFAKGLFCIVFVVEHSIMLKSFLDGFKKISNSNIQINKTIAYLIMGIAIAFGITLIMYDANWVYGDDSQFWISTAIGKPIFGWHGDGRFWPLGLADYNILLLMPFGHTVTAHYLWNSVLFLAGMIFSLKFLQKITDNDYFSSLVAITILMFSGAFWQVNITLPTAERIIWILYAAFMLSLWKAEKKQSTKYYVVSLLIAAYMTYAKEPIFGTFLIIAFTRFVFEFKQLTKKDRLFYGALVVVALSYVVTYAYLWLQNPPNWTYKMGRSELRGLALVLELLNVEPIMWMTGVLCVARLFSIVYFGDKNNLLVDSLLFAGGGYFMAMFFLNLHEVYLFIPSVFLSLPAFARFLHSLRKYNNLWIQLGTMCVMLLPLWKDVYTSAAYLERMYAKRQYDVQVVDYLYQQSIQGKRIIWVLFDNAAPDPIGERIITFFNWNFFLNFKYTYEVNVVRLVNNLDLADENTIILFPTLGQDMDYLLSHPKMQNYYLRWHCMAAYTAIFVPKTLLQ